MTYRIDSSFDMRKTKNVTEMKEKLKNIALLNNCNMHFFDYEIMGHGRTINRNHAIFTVYFESEENIINFIKLIKKVKGIFIESVSLDDCKFELIYASKKYLNFMDKFKAKDYKNDKKNLLLGPYKLIINQIITKN